MWRVDQLLSSQSLHATGGTHRGRDRCHHQPEALEQEHGPLRRSTPYKLAALALAILHVSVAPGIFQAAILKDAVDKDAVIQD